MTAVAPESPSRAPTAAQPLAPAGASYLAAVSAALLIAVGAVGVRDAVVLAGWAPGSPWLQTAVEQLDGMAPAQWMLLPATVFAVIGLACVILGVKPRRRRAVPVSARSTVFLDLADLARTATATAQSVPGVVSARSSAGRRVVTVWCATTGPRSTTLQGQITEALTAELSVLAHPPKLRIRIRTEA